MAKINDWIKIQFGVRHKGWSIAGVYLIFLGISLVFVDISVDQLETEKGKIIDNMIDLQSEFSAAGVGKTFATEGSWYKSHYSEVLTRTQYSLNKLSSTRNVIDVEVNYLKNLKYLILLLPNTLFSASILSQENDKRITRTAWFRFLGMIAFIVINIYIGFLKYQAYLLFESLH